jgi:transcriptional regulator
MSADFSDVPMGDVLDFAATCPLAWIVPSADPSTALLMPLLIETDEDGNPASVLGHLPRRAAATDILRQDGRAVFLFLGANAYIPPAWISAEGWAPTWNFVSLKIGTAATIVDATLTESAVEALVGLLETQAGSDWGVEKIGPRYQSLLSAIIGFRAPVRTFEPRFKLGQDETSTSRDEIRRALVDHPLANWIG